MNPRVEANKTRQRLLEAEDSVVQPIPNNAIRADGKIMMRVQSVSDNHLVCRTWDGTKLGTIDIKVAKQEELCKSPFSPTNTTGDGKTYTYASGTQRTVVQGLTTETQVIVPAYRLPSGNYKGSLIYVDRVAGKGSDIVVSGKRLKFVHIDARAWAKQ